MEVRYFSLFGLVLTHSLSKLYTVYFLASLLYEECFVEFSEFFSTGSIGWGIGLASLSIFVGVV